MNEQNQLAKPAPGGLELMIPTDDKTKIEIIPFGTDEKIQLNVSIVQKIIAVPTRSGKQPDSTQCIKFMMLCKARHLNPFEGDAYLLGYDTQNGPQFSLITAHQVFLKRAEASEGFSGMQSGVIVEKDGALIEREGDLTLTGEKLLGGWAKVYRKNIEHPFYRRLKLETFSTGRSRWEKDPAGMIVKCAEADALRSAFPTHLGGLYLQEERPPIEAEAAIIPRAQIQAPITATTSTTTAQPETPTPRGRKKKPAPADSSSTSPESIPAEPGTVLDQITAKLAAAGFTPAQLLRVAIINNWADTTVKELSEIEEPKLRMFLEDWESTLGELEAHGKAPEDKPPFD